MLLKLLIAHSLGDYFLQTNYLAMNKGKWNGTRLLDGKKVDYISTFFDEAVASNSISLAQNYEYSEQGSLVLGQGFIISSESAQSFIKEDERNKNIIMPYINGDDLNSNYDQKASRWIINFFDRPLNSSSAPVNYKGDFAEDYPDLLKIVERDVKPTRVEKKKDGTLYR